MSRLSLIVDYDARLRWAKVAAARAADQWLARLEAEAARAALTCFKPFLDCYSCRNMYGLDTTRNMSCPT
eukprot:11065148-Prorocentrum_lima.AAC.1